MYVVDFEYVGLYVIMERASKLVPAAARNPKGINRAAAAIHRCAWALLGALGGPRNRLL